LFQIWQTITAVYLAILFEEKTVGVRFLAAGFNRKRYGLFCLRLRHDKGQLVLIYGG
jgi:hypothetical protein